MGLAPYARAGLCAALSAAGCLAAPPASTGSGGDAAGGDADGGGDGTCTAFVEDSFDEPDESEALFAIDEDPPDATVAIGAGTATLEAHGGAVVGYASMRTLETYDVADSALEIQVDVTIAEEAVVILSLDTDGQASYDLRGHADHLAVSHDDADTGETQVDCDPCESFGDGPWTMRIEDRNGMLHFLAGPQGDTPSDLFPEGLAGGGLPVHAQVWLLAPAVDDTALASVQALTWSRCGE